ncbi:Kinesin-like protein KIF15 [Galdieria sulphuraria]|uniref:Kinesin-like protein n=1 Tax=Galdieria sulphuraria TaxID=130081 RepID=M2WTY0_GALSU|nr:kinesin family member [Galdieria sulphuraria]EME27355.1 kinesin family member [Galdieria sulphuraria]GJD09509.1 Kinesin-like protein KIF15 [Galdieria sulphuraria]|eukprot:XP_005703875.1 kinesin family member [Galdieria sulphuraria]
MVASTTETEVSQTTKPEENGGDKDIYAQLEEIAASTSECVRVVIRIRPLNEREQNTLPCLEVGDGGRNIVVNDQGNAKKFTFDSIFPIDGKQEDVFRNVAKPIIDSCLAGYNGTIFAYGQTGSGKTFTMQGPEESIQAQSGDIRQLRGIMPRVFEYIFDSIQKEREEKGSAVDYVVKCAYLQVYNETITDLLTPSQHNLNIREDTLKGVYVEDLTEEVVKHPEDCYRVLRKGVANRTVSATSMNQESSRSHGVFTVIIERKEEKPDNLVSKRVSRLNLVDLAGSERQKLAKTSGQTLKEASNINRSLSVLGYVIMALVDASNGKERHINYRDSKLTFLLKDSLGGNAKTCMVATVSPSDLNLGETISTLKFAQRAKYIRNKAYVNEETTGSLVQLQAEVRRLQDFVRQLLAERENSVTCKPANEQERNSNELVQLMKESESDTNLDEDKSYVDERSSRDSSFIHSNVEDTEELSKLLACAEQREREIADEKRYIEALLMESQNENKKRKANFELLETAWKNLAEKISAMEDNELVDSLNFSNTCEQDTQSSSDSILEQEEAVTRRLCETVYKLTDLLQTTQNDNKHMKAQLEEKETLLNNLQTETKMKDIHKEQNNNKEGNNSFLAIHGDSPVLNRLRKKIADSQESSGFQKKELVDESQLDYRELAQVEFLKERLAELLQIEAKQGENMQKLNAEKATLEKSVEKLKAEVNFLTEELQAEKENAQLLREQFSERERNTEHFKDDAAQMEEKIQHLQSKVRSLQTYRVQLQRLVDQQSEEIKSLRLRAQNAWDELIHARQDFESQERLRSDRLEKLFAELAKHQRQDAGRNDQKAAAYAIKEQMKQNLQTMNNVKDVKNMPPLEPLMNKALEFLLKQASGAKIASS